MTGAAPGRPAPAPTPAREGEGTPPGAPPVGLFVRHWPLRPDRQARGLVLLVHGLGEHCGRYARLAAQLNAWGFSVIGYDQFGHGQSAGARGALPDANRFTDDLAAMCAFARRQADPKTPLLLLGHSMGGLISSLAVLADPKLVDALILSSPALDAGLKPMQKMLVALLMRLAPDLRAGNGLKVEFLSHDAAEVAAYGQDPLVHDRVSARLARYIAEQGRRVIAAAPQWTCPTLLLYAGDDRLVSPAGSRAFAQGAPTEVVSTTCFDGLYHEIFNEIQAAREGVLEVLEAWLDTRFEPTPARLPDA